MSLLTVEKGIEVHYSDDGHGPVVLLLHGWACDGSDWSWLAADLAADHRVIIPDHRGHGRSTPTAGRFGAKVLAADAAALLEALSIDHAVVVGHSMGTLVASALAVERPDLVTALILIDPVYGQTGERIAAALEAIRSHPTDTAAAIFSQFYVDDSPPWLAFWHRRRLLGTPPNVVAEALCALYEGPNAVGLRTVGETYLARRKCPMLVVYGGTSLESRSGSEPCLTAPTTESSFGRTMGISFIKRNLTRSLPCAVSGLRRSRDHRRRLSDEVQPAARPKLSRQNHCDVSTLMPTDSNWRMTWPMS